MAEVILLMSSLQGRGALERWIFLEICISANKNVETLQVYALKVMKKVGENVPSFYCEERDIMARTTSLWHTKLDYAFQVGNLW